jgi:hypothetical protein
MTKHEALDRIAAALAHIEALKASCRDLAELAVLEEHRHRDYAVGIAYGQVLANLGHAATCVSHVRVLLTTNDRLASADVRSA